MLKMRHNLVTLLYTIKGSIEIHRCRLDEGRFRDREEELLHTREIMKKIYKQTERALLITRKIGLAMKMSQNAYHQRDEISIREIWREITATLQKGCCHKKTPIELIDHISEGFPNIHCERKDFKEILYCLALNAIQAMSLMPSEDSPVDRNDNGRIAAAGKLIIRTSLGFRPGENPLAHITLADTGPGIAEETLHHLFEPFVTTKSLDQGNGLGLCIVKGLVRRNGGSISVSSFKGCGTTFMMTFPVAKAGDRKEPLALLR